MKKLLIMALSMVLILIGCGVANNETAQSSDVPNPETKIVFNKESVEGKIEESYIENNNKYVELKVQDEIYKLEANNVNDFESIQADDIYRIEFETESKKITDITKINLIPAEAGLEERNKRVINIEPTLDITGLSEYKIADISGFPEFGITKVILYTDAVKDERGIIHWDDGNRFVLIAHTADSGYILFDERIQFGSMDINIYSLNDVLYIAAMDSATADINFRIYELINGNFEEDIIFNGEGNINMLYTSM